MDLETDREIEDLISDREKFNKFVYMPIDEAIKVLRKNRLDYKLGLIVKNLLSSGIPAHFTSGPRAIFFSTYA